jgi:hypothetical protein
MGRQPLSKQIRSSCAGIFVIFIFVYSLALRAEANGAQNPKNRATVKTPKAGTKVKLKPLKPLSEKDLQKANKKALEASSGKSIQKANQKILKNQAKTIQKGNKKAAQANKALQKAHAKALREAQKQAKVEAAKKN